jgi:hypothetical protein
MLARVFPRPRTKVLGREVRREFWGEPLIEAIAQRHINEYPTFRPSETVSVNTSAFAGTNPTDSGVSL